MTMPSPSHSHSGTYFVEDQHLEEELLRLANQDRMVNALMGGVLVEQDNPGLFREILDVACGTGNWAIDVAQTYPETIVVGIDINPRMIATAQEQAEALHLQGRVEFRVMDALSVLHFPDRSFDLVNLRFALGFVRTWEWPRLLADLMRVLRPGGVIRLTDEEVIHQSTSPASMQFCELLLSALFRSGHLFAQESTGLTSFLPSLLNQQGFLQIQTHAYILQYQAGTPEGQTYARNGMLIVRSLRPFLQKWGCLPNDYPALQQRVTEEISQPDFSATWHLLTAWGTKADYYPRAIPSLVTTPHG